MDLSWLLGHSRLTYTHSPSPISLRSTSTSSLTSLLSICESSTPPCTLNPLLFNGHLQTFWTAVKSTDIPIHYKRHIFSSIWPEYAGTFAVDFAVSSSPPSTNTTTTTTTTTTAPTPQEEESPDTSTLPPRTTFFSSAEFQALGSSDNDQKPMLIALHGLSGGSHEIYLRCVLQPLLEAGWEACVVNSRGCAGTSISTPMLYNARATWDVRQVVRWARNTWPRRKLFGIGFSLGANIMTNYLGEEGENCLLKAAVVCSNPWNLDVGSNALQRSWLGLNVYSKVMGTSMRAMFEKHADKMSENPKVNLERIRKIRYLYEFDRELQGPVWGYPSESAYYRDASSCDSLSAVRIPLFAINAEDDPIAHRDAIPWVEFTSNPYAVLLTTSTGGHLSWFEWGGTRWFAKPAAKFLMKMAEDLEVETPQAEDQEQKPGEVHISKKVPPFDPMRRRKQMPHVP